MAGGGIGEAALISAAIGGTTAAATGGDPFRGALLGGLTGGLTSGIGGALSGSALPAASAADLAAGAAVGEVGGTAGLTALANTAPAGATGTLSAMNPMNATNMSEFLRSGKDLGIGTLAMTGGGAGLAEAMRAERDRYGIPAAEKYEGPLSKFTYNPATYMPYTYRPYAEGGIASLADGGSVERMSEANAVGANTGYPMANISRGAYATPYQQPISQNVVTGSQDTRVDSYTGEERLADGGIASLGSYSDGGRLLRGPGDGVSDSIPAVIGGRQPARLADGEFVVPARIVSEIGNGSTDAGARELYKMMDRVQSARGKTMGKRKMAKDTNASKYLPA